MRLTAARTIPHTPDDVFTFLADLRNHWRLEDAFVELGALEGDGPHGPTSGRIRIRGPLGLSRTAKTLVLTALPPVHDTPGMLEGRGEVGRRSVGRVRWEIAAGESGSQVTFIAVVERASVLDHVLLRLGGRRWLERRLADALARLEVVLSA